MLSSAAAYYLAKSYRSKVPPKKVAIVGSGCSGLGALWALQDSQHEVHLYEQSERLGGHTNTCQWKSPTTGETTPVDTGFIVLNSATYPNFIRFLQQVNVPTAETQMTFGVSRDGGRFEWSGNAEGIFAQRSNFFRPRHWRMIFDIIRFNEFALDLLREDDAIRAREAKLNGRKKTSATKALQNGSGELDPRAYKTIGAYLHEQGYSQAFKDDYLIPMTAAVWSTSPDKASLDFPAITLVRFMWNHHLLSTIATRPLWLTIPGGSQRYIDAITTRQTKKKYHIHRANPVTQLKRLPNGKIELYTSSSAAEPTTYDHVILACHGDEILPLLEPSNSATELEKSILSKFLTTENKAYLHSDLSLMPSRKKVYTAWNYLTTSSPSREHHPAGVALTYWMNLLQHIPASKFGDVLVTLNPPHPPRRSTVQGEYTYRHPLYTPAAVHAQTRLDEIQNVKGLSFAGAWTGYGFHEDGFTSGLKVAVGHLGVQLPFELADSTFSRGKRPALGLRDRVVRMVVSVIQLWVLLVVWVAGLGPVAAVCAVVGGGFEAVVARVDCGGHGGRRAEGKKVR